VVHSDDITRFRGLGATATASSARRPPQAIAETRVLRTYVGGAPVQTAD